MAQRPTKAERKAMVKDWKEKEGKREGKKAFFSTGMDLWTSRIAFRLCFFAAFLSFLYAGIQHGLNAWAKTWPETRAVVLNSGIRSEKAWFQGKRYASSPRMVFTPWIRYQYEWKGETHEGNRQWVCDLFLSQNTPTRAQEEIASYSKGREIAIRVCPTYPTYVVLRTHGYAGAFLPSIVGVFALLIGAALFFLVDKGAIKRSKN